MLWSLWNAHVDGWVNNLTHALKHGKFYFVGWCVVVCWWLQFDKFLSRVDVELKIKVNGKQIEKFTKNKKWVQKV